MTFIIGLLGGAGAGKSTVADHIVERYGARRYVIADPIKQIAQQIYGFSDEQVRGSRVAKETIDPRWGISPRRAFQVVGTTLQRTLGDDVWMRNVMRRIAQDAPELAVIEDVRLAREADALRGHLVVLLDPPGRVGCTSPDHATETEWQHAFRHVEITERSLPLLYQNVYTVLTSCGIWPKDMT